MAHEVVRGGDLELAELLEARLRPRVDLVDLPLLRGVVQVLRVHDLHDGLVRRVEHLVHLRAVLALELGALGLDGPTLR